MHKRETDLSVVRRAFLRKQCSGWVLTGEQELPRRAGQGRKEQYVVLGAGDGL